MQRSQPQPFLSATVPPTPPRRRPGAYLLMLLIMISLLAFIFWQEWRIDHAELVNEAEAAVALQADLVAHHLELSISDLLILSQMRMLRQYANGGGDNDRRHLEEAFQQLIVARPLYDQIRLLDPSGMEIIRVNFNDGRPAIVADAELQNKANRYYFQAATTLAPGDIYVSPLDLNIEHGKVERPFKPVIRLAMPIYADSDTLAGVLVLNYLADTLIDKITPVLPDSPYQSMLLNSDGYWLQHPDPEMAWGFMFDERTERRFDTIYPAVWQTIQTEGNGQTSSSAGIFLFHTITPLSAGHLVSIDIGATADLTDSSAYHWYIVAHIPAAVLRQHQGRILLPLLPPFLLLVIGGVLSAAAMSQARLRREQQQAKLVEQEALLHTVASFASDWDYWLDETGKFRYISPACHKVTGYTAQAFAADPRMLLTLVHPDDRASMAAHMAADNDSETEAAFDFRIINRDGAVRWLNHHCLPVVTDDGRYRGRRASNRDITSQKQTEAALRHSQQRLQQILRSTRAGTWEWQIQTGETVFNERWAQIIGYTLTNLAPVSIQTWLDHIHPDDLARSNELLQRHFTEELSYYECEVRMRHRQGHWEQKRLP